MCEITDTWRRRSMPFASFWPMKDVASCIQWKRTHRSEQLYSGATDYCFSWYRATLSSTIITALCSAPSKLQASREYLLASASEFVEDSGETTRGVDERQIDLARAVVAVCTGPRAKGMEAFFLHVTSRMYATYAQSLIFTARRQDMRFDSPTNTTITSLP